jgi:predicted transposase/invertase (TIGR01784 family)
MNSEEYINSEETVNSEESINSKETVNSEENMNSEETVNSDGYISIEEFVNTNKRLNPLNDFLFMKYMGEKGDEEQLIGFLNAVLEKTCKARIVSITILEDRMHSAKFIGDKSSILDVRARMSDKTIINIEVQLKNVTNMDRRSLFYWSREYVLGIGAGDEYAELPNVIAINILGQKFLGIDEVHSSFHLWEDTHKDYKLTDALEMHFIDMVRFRSLTEKDIENNPIHRWLAFFDQRTDNNTIKKIKDMDTAIRKAIEKIDLLARDRVMMREYAAREKEVLDFNSTLSFSNKEKFAEGKKEGIEEGIAIGEQEGIEEGIAIGKQKAQQKNVLRFSQKGLSAVEISEWLDLPVEEIKKILNHN